MALTQSYGWVESLGDRCGNCLRHSRHAERGAAIGHQSEQRAHDDPHAPEPNPFNEWIQERVDDTAQAYASSPEVMEIIEFIRAEEGRPITMPAREL